MLCSNDNNPIIIVRDVKTRFYSMYKYWKYGSEKWKRGEKNKIKNKDKSIFHFINLIKTKNKKELHLEHLYNFHFKETSHWINNTDYKNIIIIRYENNLNKKIQKLINKLDIKNKNIPVPIVNVSCTNKSNGFEYDLNNKRVNKFINNYFTLLDI